MAGPWYLEGLSTEDSWPPSCMTPAGPLCSHISREDSGPSALAQALETWGEWVSLTKSRFEVGTGQEV